MVTLVASVHPNCTLTIFLGGTQVSIRWSGVCVGQKLGKQTYLLLLLLLLPFSPSPHTGVSVCVDIHKSVAKKSLQFKVELSHCNYVTPTSYLELLATFRDQHAGELYQEWPGQGGHGMGAGC